jgi:hypothetical protein
METTGEAYLTDEPIAGVRTGVLRTELAPQSSVHESDDNLNFSDDGFDFPPTAHPGREMFTFSLFVLLVLELLGGWNLISWILTSLI